MTSSSYNSVIKAIYQSYNKYLQSVFGNVLVHHLMLRDYIRVSKFHDVIRKYANQRKVLDLGCGTGILSILAVRAGATAVYAIEETPIIHLAEKLALVNGVRDRITFIPLNSLTATIGETVDLLIAEIIGNDPLAEGIVPYLIDARKRFLSADGRIVPLKVQVFCLGVASKGKQLLDLELVIEEARTLTDLYELDFSPYIEEIEQTSLTVDSVTQDKFHEANQVLTEEVMLQTINFHSVTDPNFTEIVSLLVTRDGPLNGFAVYFRAHLDESTIISTSPAAARTCWEILIYRLGKARDVRAGQTVNIMVEYNGELSGGVKITLLEEL